MGNLEYLVRERLGDNYDSQKISVLGDYQIELNLKYEESVSEVEARKITGEQFWERINLILNTYFSKIAELLGLRDYETLTGLKVGEDVTVFDLNIVRDTDYTG